MSLLQINSDICTPKIVKIERDVTKLMRKQKGCSFLLQSVVLCLRIASRSKMMYQTFDGKCCAYCSENNTEPKGFKKLQN